MILKLKKNKFYHHKTLIILKDVDNEKLLVLKNISFGEKKKKNHKYFIGYFYNDNKVIKLNHYIYRFLKQAHL